MTQAQAYDGVKLLPGDRPTPEHELKVHEKLAALLCGVLEVPARVVAATTVLARPYYLPARTLVGPAAAELAITSEEGFFGGSVSEAFIATKAISHPIFPGGMAPGAWAFDFAGLADGALLPGWTVFSKADARRAAVRMLEQAPFRLKPVLATAGRGQRVIADLTTLDMALDEMEDAELARCGIVLEENLMDVETFSVGQVRVGGLVASYYGTQCLTRDNAGEQVYGGSSLVIHRGGYETLLQSDLPAPIRAAIAHARAYEAAVERSYPGFMASRRNYDIALGRAYDGRRLSGVMEQSWRAGGASSAEMLALHAFKQDPSLNAVQASTHEVFGPTTVPNGAELFFQGEDAEIGLITKYARIKPHGHSQ